ncbi:right-handed parallel beta-helix repeat-containing protein [Paenibacillus taichungensis]|uniref:right-handed parallel beta-helix repeat-containing protein n=2 Tax=Paenibacillus TaxID=44249 RepID=UPI00096FDEE3|nr:right-handed parallel beta-helix repeat-containing protein [Paenibacillus taichungensis]MEC0107109.1 right-handed parallel beta-helix repeat-containing protein [Paenibacillus taichungensis]MEC0194959.1 right-handed parallel beta-helix repeat-containing protein [Paenibacillus taichungensis]OME81081.1 hypothetical protein BK122_16670 [Paenibacillus pabuli]
MDKDKTKYLNLYNGLTEDEIRSGELAANFTQIDEEIADRGIHITWNGADRTGVKGSSSALISILTEDKDVIIIPQGIFLIDKNVTIPPDKQLVFQRNGRLKIKKGVTLTILGPIDARPYEWIFDISLGGTVTGEFQTESVYPQWFGAKADGFNNDAPAIQAAENFAFQRGGGIIVFPFGTYGIKNKIIKRSSVHWRGAQAKIKRIDNLDPSGAAFSLVYAEEDTFDWSIQALEFENIPHNILLDKSIYHNFGPGKNNSCIDAYRCSEWIVRDCVFRKFSQGILYRGCETFTISNNRFYGESGKSIDSILEGTLISFSSYVYTGAIIFAFTSSAAEIRNAGNFLISDNYIEVPGLDIGIDALAQTWNENPSIVSENIILGPNCGIQIYKGSFHDPLNAPTYRGNIQVHNNRLYATWEQGIYIRYTNGVTISHNYLERVAQKPGGDIGSSGGGIVTRVNPFNLNPHSPGPSDHVGVDILYNRIVNPGQDNQRLDGAIHIRLPNCRVIGNDIIRETNLYPLSLGKGILIDNGEGILQAEIRGNRIRGFEYGMFWAGTAKKHEDGEACIIDGNTIRDCSTAIFIDPLRIVGIQIRANFIISANTGLILKRAPYSFIEDNHFHSCVAGVVLRSGNLASDYVTLKSGGEYTGIDTGMIAGGTVTVRNNHFLKVTIPHNVAETSQGDASFHGRCVCWEGDRVNGRVLRINDFPYAKQPAAYTAKIWHKHDRVYNTIYIKGNVYERICINAGMYGRSPVIPIKGTISENSDVITEISSVRNIGLGQYLNVEGITVYVKEVNYTENSVYTDVVFLMNKSDVDIVMKEPTFMDLITWT